VSVSTIGHRDVTTLAIDPTDFDHVLVGSHNNWINHSNAGVLETMDGGETFIVHDPIPSWTVGSMGVNFLYHPGSGTGDANTWLVGTDGDGFWRTSDAGETWTKVFDSGITHHGQNVLFTSDGVLYAGAATYPARSRDNGVTWEHVSGGLEYAYYYTVATDGDFLYTMIAHTGSHGRDAQPYVMSPVSDGENWTPYRGGAQRFLGGPFNIEFDSVNRIFYSANWGTGLLALRLEDP
jgi:photosystem II stability/assembly factor-like uncharacterized protein